MIAFQGQTEQTAKLPTRYESCADTAKRIRRTLKEKFPATKFSVRSSNYAGGASVSVQWTDGPSVGLVDAEIQKFASSWFDGMQDLKCSTDHWLIEDGHEISFGCDYVQTQRRKSVEFTQRVAQMVAKKFGLPMLEISANSFGGTAINEANDAAQAWRKCFGDFPSTIIHRYAENRDYPNSPSYR